MKLIEYKLLNFSSDPDPDGDIITKETQIDIEEDLKLYDGLACENNFISFLSKAKRCEDGVYISIPVEIAKKFNGSYICPEGSCVGTRDGAERIVNHLIIRGCTVAPNHVDPSISPVKIVDTKNKLSFKRKKR